VCGETLVKPETVIGWHRRGFRAYWRWKSRRRGGRPRINLFRRVLLVLSAREDPSFRAMNFFGFMSSGLRRFR
jgi:hypothetical protein